MQILILILFSVINKIYCKRINIYALFYSYGRCKVMKNDDDFFGDMFLFSLIKRDNKKNVNKNNNIAENDTDESFTNESDINNKMNKQRKKSNKKKNKKRSKKKKHIRK